WQQERLEGRLLQRRGEGAAPADHGLRARVQPGAGGVRQDLWKKVAAHHPFRAPEAPLRSISTIIAHEVDRRARPPDLSGGGFGALLRQAAGERGWKIHELFSNIPLL